MAEDARANRPDQATAEAEAAALPRLPVQAGEDYLRLMERLRETVADRPDDVQGQRLLARNEAALGNFADARAAQERVVALLGDAAAGQDYADLADLMVLGAGGYVSPEAEAALARALERDPTNGAARDYSGLLMIQVGRPDLGFRLWSGLLEQSRPDDPWVGPIASQIRGLAQIAGERNYQMPQLSAAPLPPAPPPGPTTEQVEAAADMTPEERMEMIRGMVTGLSDRLASEGGPPEDWARLIGALGVLGEAEQARAIAEEAEEVFAGNDPALSMIAEARIRAGLD
jgi:cytochrome c-type biogenesis protein CcmH